MSDSQVSPAPESSSPSSPLKQKREMFGVLDGVRVLLTFWVVCFHTLWHYAMFVDRKVFEDLYHNATSSFLAGGLNGVDYFLVLTGFLVAYPVFLGARTETWFEFVWMRITRVYPMLITSILLFCLGISKFGSEPYLRWEKHVNHALKPTIDASLGYESLGMPNNCEITWTNLLFINNFVPFGGCMGWTWSLCIQVHFFLIFPLILKWFGKGRGLMIFCGIMTVAWVTMRSLIFYKIVVDHVNEHTPMYIYSVADIKSFFVMFNIWYSNTFQRIGACFAGVILAYLQVSKPQWLRNLHGNLIFTSLSTLLTFAALFMSFDVHFDNPIQTIWFSVGSLGHVAAISTLFYLLINDLGPLSFITPLLKLKIFKHLAYPSYGVYLAHSYIIVWLYKQDFWPLLPVTNYSFAINCVIVLILSYIYAYLATRFIEEPIKNFLRKYVDPTPSTTPASPITTAHVETLKGKID